MHNCAELDDLHSRRAACVVVLRTRDCARAELVLARRPAIRLRDERGAEAAFNAMRTRFYEGRPVCPEYSPVTDFREATCRQYEEENCSRGGNCNFMHVKHANRLLEARLFTRQRKKYLAIRDSERDRDRDYRRGRSRSRSRSRERSPSRENSEERRARIASWNKSRKEQRQEEDNSEE